MKKLWIAAAVIVLIAVGLWGYDQTRITPEVRSTLQSAMLSLAVGGKGEALTETQLSSATAAARTVRDRRVIGEFRAILADGRVLDEQGAEDAEREVNENASLNPSEESVFMAREKTRDQKWVEIHGRLDTLGREIGLQPLRYPADPW